MLLQIHEPGQTPLPHQGRGQAIGIDLGTTNSVVGISENQQVRILELEGSSLVPSVVFYGEEKRIGRSALGQIEAHPNLVVRSVKRLLGQSLEEISGRGLPFNFLETQETELIQFKVGSSSLNPVEVSADILRYLKEKSEKELGYPITQAVITVPAYFSERARQGTREAAHLAGLEVLRLLNEPTAAALAYNLDEGQEGIYVVYDLGGGTFDLSILRLEKGIFQVLAVGGDTLLGGDDIDHLILKYLSIPSQNHQKALTQAQAIKEYLSFNKEWVGKVEGDTLRFSQEELNILSQPLIEKTLKICQRTLKEIHLDTYEDIQKVLLVGGATRMPLIRRALEDMFGEKLLYSMNPDEVVARGAALQAEALTQGTGKLLLDVTPLSLGLETKGGFMEKIISRNTALPCSASQEFTTFQEGQTALTLHVFQGESDHVKECRSLARFTLKGIPPLPAGQARIKVTFTLDADGILSVIAQEKSTGKSHAIQVNASYGLTEEQILKILKENYFSKKKETELS